MRALLALDAKAAGASDLQIARILVPSTQIGDWSSDSAVRALVRDALKRGRTFRDGRWPELVWGAGRRPVRA
ncbi:DNA -binding domain-containing protein [Phenylobacterium sp.]|uniref:DNA -binding domain-containing protein n=1 Tax=Phenylobacterium sp. TaxID=1871053 RepID=UPI003FA76AEF